MNPPDQLCPYFLNTQCEGVSDFRATNWPGWICRTQSRMLLHLQEQLFHVADPQLLPPRQMLLQQPGLLRCDLVLLELALGFEKCLHVSDERFGRRWR